MPLGLWHTRKLLDSLRDDVQALAELHLGDYQRRSKADDISVSGLGLHRNALVSLWTTILPMLSRI